MSGDNGHESYQFKTSDLYLAAALKVVGFKLQTIEFLGKKGIFVFEDKEDRQKIVIDYFAGKLRGSLKDFSNTWADLKSAVTDTEVTTNGYSYHR
jgi:hypothetical protein